MLFEQNGMVVRGVGVFAACGHECQDSDYIPRFNANSECGFSYQFLCE